MLRLTAEQMEAFNAPLWQQLEERVIQFCVSRAELNEPDAAFIQTAAQQLIPRARRNGMQKQNDIVRFVYLSLLAEYKASGQDICQRMQVPYTSDGLRYAEQVVVAELRKQGT